MCLTELSQHSSKAHAIPDGLLATNECLLIGLTHPSLFYMAFHLRTARHCADTCGLPTSGSVGPSVSLSD